MNRESDKIIAAIKLLDLDTAITWFLKDARDDFYPDVLGYRDYRAYLKDIKLKVKSIDSYETYFDKVPKKGGMLRDAIWIHPELRIIYTAILHYLLPKIDHKVPDQIYSYRRDSEDNDQYPFNNSIMRWKGFHNDAISACLDEKIESILVTDLTSYYDHINVDNLISIIEDILGPSISKEDRLILFLLKKLLLSWSTKGFGIPQNIDTSSFLGSIYLYHVDKSVLDNRFRYFRWVDDIKICAQNERQAHRALHHLQDTLLNNRLFISGAKTSIYNKSNAEDWNDIVDVTDDKLISDFEIAIDEQDHAKIQYLMDDAKNLLEKHSAPGGNDKIFRAIANRLLDCCSMYSALTHAYNLNNKIIEKVIDRIDTHPEKMNVWCDMLSCCDDKRIIDKITYHLIKRPSLYNWHRYHTIRLLTSLPIKLSEEMQSTLWSSARGEISRHEAYISIICLGKHLDNNSREKIFDVFFKSQSSILIKRSVLISIQELPHETRNKKYNEAISINPQLKPLVDYLSSLEKPNYGIKTWTKKKVREHVYKKNYSRKGVGIVKGKTVSYSLSKSDFSYD